MAFSLKPGSSRSVTESARSSPLWARYGETIDGESAYGRASPDRSTSVAYPAAICAVLGHDREIGGLRPVAAARREEAHHDRRAG